MKKRTVLATTLIGSAGALALASTGTASTPAKGPQKAFEFKAHGLRVDKGVENSAKHDVAANGRVHQQERARVTLKGHGARVLKGEVIDDPIASGGTQRAIITDEASGAVTEFSYSPGSNGITLKHGDNSVSITQNPDHSYLVDGAAAATGKAAVALLKGNPAYDAVDPHSLALAYTYAHAPMAASKNTQNCDLPECIDPATGKVDATPPSVCGLFDDFCECAICDKTGAECTSCK